ncbi:pentapeptide repeats family protein [Mycobacterium ulcerans str. Harvey]|uniref:Pentapeptide repeats family protein n=1 Tax=Mycobacterium ulcerans str. Harvey TaxID=1299332 RepID=A0ABN0QNR9_MYCUL|nr:pentapeptide repeats family protein [Mycobacterium ulcerans str. Harvey]
MGLFNSGDGNIGFFNSGSGNFGIANSGSFNTGIANAGLTNTGWFNSGLANTGWGNAGAYNSGGFNAGAYNTGSFNPGHVNIGWFNTGDTNTGLGNSGNINTGAFVSGDMNNGFFWRGTGQGLIGADYTITIPQIPLTIGGGGILNIPITGAITGLTVQSFTVHGVGSAATPIPVNLHLNVDGESGGATVSVHIPNTDVSFDVHVDGLPITLDLPLDSEVRPIVVPDIPISRIPIVLSLGSDSTSLNTAIGAGIGPISSPFRFSICRRRLASATRPIARRRDSSTRVPGCIGLRQRRRHPLRSVELRLLCLRTAELWRQPPLGYHQPGWRNLWRRQHQRPWPGDSRRYLRYRECRQSTVRSFPRGLRALAGCRVR